MNQRHRLRAAVSNERGSVAASFVFVVFVSIVLASIVAAVISSLTATTETRKHSAVNSEIALLKSSYLNTIIDGGSFGTDEHCIGGACGWVTFVEDTGDQRKVTFEARTDDDEKVARIVTLSTVGATMISGYDTNGNPVWTNRADTTPHVFTHLASGGDSSCAIDDTQALWCWGSNDSGQLGDGTTTDRNKPVKASGETNFTSIHRGTDNTTCAIDAAKNAWCWGDNTSGQLGTGDGTMGTGKTSPAKVAGGHQFSSLAQSVNTTCGLDTAGAAWCWGKNTGDGTSAHSPTPAAVAGGHQFTKLTMDANTACGIDTAGKAWCWTANDNGAPGNGSTAAQDTPVPVDGGHTFISLQAGYNADSIQASTVCGIDAAGDAWCWGDNAAGQLGDGTADDASSPVKVKGGHVFDALAVGGSSVCGIDDTGHLHCWGSNSHGQLGDGTTTDSNTPVAADPATTFTAVQAPIGAGNWFCGITTGGRASCWGQNDHSQANSSITGNVTSPEPVAGLEGVQSLSLGSSFGCVTDARNHASCWGENATGQTGSGTTSTTAEPAPAERKPYSPSRFTGYLNGGR